MATTPFSSTEPIQPQAASFGRLLLAQTRIELMMALRQGERVLITLFVPILLLIAFSAFKLLPVTAHESEVDLLLPGILALAIMSAGMVSLGIATAYERHYGVLKRLGASPLPRSGLIIAKVISVLALELIQMLLLLGVARFLYGWRPEGSLALAILVAILGTVTFSALGLAMAGGLRAELTLVGANALYLVFLFLSGGLFPLDHLPASLAAFAQLLPAAALTEALQGTMIAGQSFPGTAFLTLVIWAVIILAVAIKIFQWE